MEEIIISLKDYEGLYEISNKGYIKNVERVITMSNGRTRTIKPKIMKTRKNNMGYHILDLYKDGVKTTVMLHRLVALSFVVNPDPDNLDQVNHKNGNKDSNYADNLEWSNNSLNVKHAHDTKLNKISNESKKRLSKNVLNVSPKDRMKEVAQYDKDGNWIQNHPSLTAAADALKINRATIRDAINGRRGQKTAKGFIWKFVD